MPNQKRTTTGDLLTNTAALEQVLETLEVRPSVAQIALGRKLAALCDGPSDELTAAMVKEYRDWLAGIESAVPDEPDALDAAQ